MSTNWECQHSLFTESSRSVAWAYWSDMRNHAEMESVKIELDGPFRTGTKGRTLMGDSQQEWELSEVIFEKRFVTTGRTEGFELSFAWDFEDAGTGTRMTQTIRAEGPADQMEKWQQTLRQMEINAPQGMKKLAAKLDQLNEGKQ